MIESKSVKCPTYSENFTIQLWQDFGWVLKSSQEVNVKDSHLESSFGNTYSVTTSEKYVKLIFERDTGMKNYAKINALQREFEQNELIPEKKVPGFGMLTFICLIPPITFLGAIMLVLKVIKRAPAKKYNAKIKPQNQEREEKRSNLRAEAMVLLQENK